ncbi:DEAD/DEAH box helicase [Candidatus Woesearchaeota archaeon]|nr:DEAD/DEAH box helicase [Candidatus Woesearchaeota archaeon]
MQIKDAEKLHPELKKIFVLENIHEFRPVQEKSLKSGLLDNKNLLVCTPTASGKTLIAEMAIAHHVLEKKLKAIYIVPLIALANEKYKSFKKRYEKLYKIALSIGDFDSSDSQLSQYDVIVCTAEKLDSLLRHNVPWLSSVGLIIIDEIHLLNDPGRGPTVEILITMFKHILKNLQVIGLSATIGNPKDLAEWLEAELIQDSWRPIQLHQGIYFNGMIEFVKE